MIQSGIAEMASPGKNIKYVFYALVIVMKFMFPQMTIDYVDTQVTYEASYGEPVDGEIHRPTEKRQRHIRLTLN